MTEPLNLEELDRGTLIAECRRLRDAVNAAYLQRDAQQIRANRAEKTLQRVFEATQRYRRITDMDANPGIASVVSDVRAAIFTDKEIWTALGYTSESGWKLALKRYDKFGARKKRVTVDLPHGGYTRAVRDKCKCVKCREKWLAVLASANERKRRDRAELRELRLRESDSA